MFFPLNNSNKVFLAIHEYIFIVINQLVSNNIKMLALLIFLVLLKLKGNVFSQMDVTWSKNYIFHSVLCYGL